MDQTEVGKSYVMGVSVPTGADITVQHDLMRHADTHTTTQVYGRSNLTAYGLLTTRLWASRFRMAKMKCLHLSAQMLPKTGCKVACSLTFMVPGGGLEPPRPVKVCGF